MAHWAIAVASGPHINFPLVPLPAAERAWKELGLAKRYASHASPVERALIEALSRRDANPQPEDPGSLDRAYADAPRRVWQEYPRQNGELPRRAELDREQRPHVTGSPVWLELR